jgi:hypothetical protein
MGETAMNPFVGLAAIAIFTGAVFIATVELIKRRTGGRVTLLFVSALGWFTFFFGCGVLWQPFEYNAVRDGVFVGIAVGVLWLVAILVHRRGDQIQ